MGIQNIGTLSHIVAATPSMTLAGLRQRSVNPNIEQFILTSDGNVDPTYVAINSAKPGITFDLSDLKAFLDSCGIAGCQLVDADTYFQQVNPYGTRKTGANHLKLSIADGMMVPRTLTASQGQLAQLAAELWAISSDGSAPLEMTASQALPGGAGTSVAWTLGPVSINGAAVEGIEQVTVDFGIQVDVIASDGAVYPSYVYIASRQPKITLRSMDSLLFDTIGLEGAAQGVTDSVVWFRKCVRGGARVADETEEHVSFTVDDGMITCGAVGVSQGQRIGTEIVITPIYDGQNAVVVVDTTAAIG